ncbi:MAG: PqqD family protein [Cyclobacteriaceae bacterium]|nr:PqqD family protein [Cyclobacteriaceae bacterium]
MLLKKNIAVSSSGFIFNPSTGDSYTVNQIASEILELLKENKSIDEVKREILKNYEVDEKSLNEDLNDFLGHLRQLRLAEDGNA